MVRRKGYLGLSNYRETYKPYKRGVNYNIKGLRKQIRELQK
jgi:hypothetical protein